VFIKAPSTKGGPELFAGTNPWLVWEIDMTNRGPKLIARVRREKELKRSKKLRGKSAERGKRCKSLEIRTGLS